MTPCDVAVSKVSLLAWQTAVISFSTDPLNISLGCSPFNAYPRKKNKTSLHQQKTRNLDTCIPNPLLRYEKVELF